MVVSPDMFDMGGRSMDRSPIWLVVLFFSKYTRWVHNHWWLCTFQSTSINHVRVDIGDKYLWCFCWSPFRSEENLLQTGGIIWGRHNFQTAQLPPFCARFLQVSDEQKPRLFRVYRKIYKIAMFKRSNSWYPCFCWTHIHIPSFWIMIHVSVRVCTIPKMGKHQQTQNSRQRFLTLVGSKDVAAAYGYSRPSRSTVCSEEILQNSHIWFLIHSLELM